MNTAKGAAWTPGSPGSSVKWEAQRTLSSTLKRRRVKTHTTIQMNRSGTRARWYHSSCPWAAA